MAVINYLDFIEEWKWQLILSSIILFLYYHYTKTFSHFEKKGVKFLKPTILLGNLGPRLMLKKSFHEFQLDIYKYFKGFPYGGIFEGRRPVMFIMDPNIIKAVTIRDFDHFVDRSALNSNEPRYLSRSLLVLKGKEWKSVRSILTPTFSSARLRNMLVLIQQCSNQMVTFLKKYDKTEIEVKDIMGHFTLEVIGACAFGIECDALTDENAKFVKIAEKFNYIPKMKRFFIFFVLIFIPQMFRFLRLSFWNFEATSELVRTLKASKAERRKNMNKRNDFLQLMIDAAAKENEDSESTKTEKYLDDDTIDAQSLLFLVAGYETSSSLLGFAIHVLATKPDLQEKLRLHVEDKTSGRELDYELLAEMTYLEGFLLETLRIYPPVARIDRVCTKPYTLPGSDVSISPGEVIAISTYGVHMDPDYYPEPEVFRPERFMGEEKNNRPSHLYLAFGAGPRNCIGLRFALLSAKLAMVMLLKNFRFSKCDKTVDPIRFDKRALLLKAEQGLWVRVEALPGQNVN